MSSSTSKFLNTIQSIYWVASVHSVVWEKINKSSQVWGSAEHGGRLAFVRGVVYAIDRQHVGALRRV